MTQTAIEGAPSDSDLDELFQPSADESETPETQQPPAKAPAGKTPETPPATPTTPAQVPLTKEDFLAGIKTLAPTQPQRQLTPQEIDKMLNVWSPNEEFIGKFFNPEATPQDRMAAFLQMRDGVITQALTAMRYMLDAHQEELNPKLSAFENFVQERQRGEMRETFLGQYPGLRKYTKLMGFISQQVEQSGFKANDVEAGYKHLADEATRFIQENIDPDFDPATDSSGFGQGQQPTQQVTEGMPSMVRSVGRGAQGMARTAQSGQKPVGPDGGIWDD